MEIVLAYCTQDAVSISLSKSICVDVRGNELLLLRAVSVVGAIAIVSNLVCEVLGATVRIICELKMKRKQFLHQK